MSETAVLSQAGEPASDQDVIFEQRLFRWSPFGTALTTLLIFLVLAVSYALTATAQGVRLFQFVADGISLPGDTRSALVISLLIATALGMQRYARVKDLLDVASNNTVMRECMMQSYAHSYDADHQRALTRRLVFATAVGVLLGICLSIGLNRQNFLTWPPHLGLVFYWFLLADIMLCSLFTRGVELTRTGARVMRTFIEQFLSIDLLRIDQLSIIGRSAARTSVVWFAVSAVSCLFFASGLSASASLGFIGACAAIGIAIFVLTLTKVHHRIKSAKAAELERVRGQIDGVRHEAHANADASLRLQGLIAYEKRIESAPEWPFDQTTAMRLGASTLILAVPWFGQAIAQSLIERLGQVVH